MTDIYIVRHAESAGNSDGRLCGRVDVDISRLGEAQLERLALRFADIPLDRIYTSPLRRAVRTAEAIARSHSCGVTPDDGLIELGCGLLDGMKWSQIKSDYPEHYAAWKNEPYNFAPPGGESQRVLYERFWETVLRLGRENDGGTIALATHGGALRCFLCRLYGMPIERLGDAPIVENTGVVRVTCDGDRLTLKSPPDASHLTPELMTVARQPEYKTGK